MLIKPYQIIHDKLQRNETVVLDGAIATELQMRGARDFKLTDSDHWGFEALHHAPDSVLAVHKSYLDAGCDLVTTNTYGILDAPAASNSTSAHRTEHIHWMDLARRAVEIARQAIEQHGSREQQAVAFSIGGDVNTADDLQTIKLLLRSLVDTPPDLILFETLSMMQNNYTREAVSLALAAGIPVWLSFRRCREGVCGIHGELWGGPEGDYFGRLATEMEQLGVGAILINCLPTHRVWGTLKWLADFTDLPLGVYPNLGRYVDPQWRFDDDIESDDFASMGIMWRDEGAQILGGCCGVRPDDIRALADALNGVNTNASPERVAARRRDDTEKVKVTPWADANGETLYPLQLPKIHCDEGVFVPTQGSYLVWKHLYQHKTGAQMRCLDIGCGAGLLSIQLALNGATEVTAIDIEQAAVANTLTNAFRNGVDGKITGRVSDLYTLRPKEKYDVVVASLYQMPTDPKGNFSSHRPVDYWGRNLLDYCIELLPDILRDNGVAYIMQVSLLGQFETQRQLQHAGFNAQVVDYSLHDFSPVFTENIAQIERVEKHSDAYHFSYGNHNVMVMYLIEVRRA